MKISKHRIETLLLVTLLTTSCFQSEKKKTGAESDLISSAVVVGSIEPGMAVKNFNQYNMTLSKITGISVADPDIIAEYETIVNSLPANHKPSGYSSFHQLSAIRLSYAYCDKFIDANAYMADGTNDAVTNKLMGKFLGSNFDLSNESILSIRQNILGIMNNQITDGGSEQIAPGSNQMGRTKMSCTALLASAHFTLL